MPNRIELTTILAPGPQISLKSWYNTNCKTELVITIYTEKKLEQILANESRFRDW